MKQTGTLLALLFLALWRSSSPPRPCSRAARSLATRSSRTFRTTPPRSAFSVSISPRRNSPWRLLGLHSKARRSRSGGNFEAKFCRLAHATPLGEDHPNHAVEFNRIHALGPPPSRRLRPPEKGAPPSRRPRPSESRLCAPFSWRKMFPEQGSKTVACASPHEPPVP